MIIGTWLSEFLQIAVVDDHKMFLEGLSLILASIEEQFNIKPYDRPDILLKDISDGKKYDLIICDLVMNQMNGLAFVAAARVHEPLTPILILSGINTEPPIREIIKLGANGFIHKSAENDTLLDAVNRLVNGQQYFDGYDVGSMQPIEIGVQHVMGDNAVPIPILGKRQIEVLRMIAKGASNKEISGTLDISPNTVKTHLRQIFIEMGVNKRTACVRKAQTLGII